MIPILVHLFLTQWQKELGDNFVNQKLILRFIRLSLIIFGAMKTFWHDNKAFSACKDSGKPGHWKKQGKKILLQNNQTAICIDQEGAYIRLYN